jgi:hypothetical protein
MKTPSSRKLFQGLAIALVGLSMWAGLNPAVAEVTPHQAVYKLTLSSKSPTSRFAGLSGAAVSQIDRTCEGWVINEQVVMSMETIAGGLINREMTFKAKESLDGKLFSFDSRSVTNGRSEKFKGSARSRDDGKSEAEFVVPEPREIPLPNNTYFYVGLTNWLVDLAKSGARAGEAMNFDGSDDSGPQKVTAFILPAKSDAEKLNGDSDLLSAKPWRARLAFFELDTQATNPEFEIALRFLENGIVTRFEMIFDDLIVDQFLEDLLPGSDESC